MVTNTLLKTLTRTVDTECVECVEIELSVTPTIGLGLLDGLYGSHTSGASFQPKLY